MILTVFEDTLQDFSSFQICLVLRKFCTNQITKAAILFYLPNTNLNLVQQAVAGFEQVTLSSGGTLALAMSDGAISNARNLVIKFAPIGVFGLVMPIILQTGFELFKPLLLFFITVILALSIHFLVTLSLLLKYVGKVNPIKHIKSMAPVLFTAFSTASSASTLPVTLKTVEKNAGVSNRTASFTLPLGATINMDGTALYECIVIIFIAQIYGVLQGFEIGLATQFSVVILALLTSVGVAGIPAASLVAITVILGAVGLPIEAVGLVWVTDRVLDMCRTTINVYSDTCGAVIIGKTEDIK